MGERREWLSFIEALYADALVVVLLCLDATMGCRESKKVIRCLKPLELTS